MKKRWLILFLCLFFPSAAYAAYEEYYPLSEKQNSFQVMERGLGNIGGMPFEISSTLVREYQMHRHAWPITYPLRLTTNSFYRMFSGINDTLLLPFAAPFLDDTPPLTKGLGLPTYPWNVE